MLNDDYRNWHFRNVVLVTGYCCYLLYACFARYIRSEKKRKEKKKEKELLITDQNSLMHAGNLKRVEMGKLELQILRAFPNRVTTPSIRDLTNLKQPFFFFSDPSWSISWRLCDQWIIRELFCAKSRLGVVLKDKGFFVCVCVWFFYPWKKKRRILVFYFSLSYYTRIIYSFICLCSN